MIDKLLKIRLTHHVMRLRSLKEQISDGTARYMQSDIYVENGVSYTRSSIIIGSRGCSIPTCTMCPFTNYNLYKSNNHPVSPITQVGSFLSLPPQHKSEIIAIYNDGSFFSDKELTNDERMGIADSVRNTKCKFLMVESLPHFMTESKLSQLIDRLGSVKLIVGVGLQSASEEIRQLCVNTSVTLFDFEHAISLAKQLKFKIKTYVMIKPPFLNESDAYHDVIETSKYLSQFRDLTSVTLCPTRIAPNTLVSELHSMNLYSPPNLFTVMACLRESINFLDSRVSTINITAEDFESKTSTTADGKHRQEIISALIRFKSEGDVKFLQLSPAAESFYSSELLLLKEGARETPTDTVRKILNIFESKQISMGQIVDTI